MSDTIASLVREVQRAEQATAIPLRCRLGWHAWKSWGDVAMVLLTFVQARKCGCCGALEWRKVWEIGNG